MTPVALPALAILALVLVAPQFLPRSRLAPVSGIALWLAALALRAVTALMAAGALIGYLPQTEFFRVATGWCIHAVLPYVSVHLGFSGYQLGETATLLPAVLLAVSVIAAVVGIWRAARALSRWLGESAIGSGPSESVIVGGPEIVVAAAGLLRARVIVSAGALAALDGGELRASLAHEQAHIGRRHPLLSLVGSLLFAIARVVPGGAKAMTELHFHLERDADESAVRLDGDPLALAAAICKAGRKPLPMTAPLMSGLASHAVPARLQLLLDRPSAKPSRIATLTAYALALAFGIGTVLLFTIGTALAAGHAGYLVDHGYLQFCQG